MPQIFYPFPLSHKFAATLADGRYGSIVHREREARFDRLYEITALYTPKELKSDLALTNTEFLKLKLWLATYNREFRKTSQTLDQVICSFSYDRSRDAHIKTASNQTRVRSKKLDISLLPAGGPSTL